MQFANFFTHPGFDEFQFIRINEFILHFPGLPAIRYCSNASNHRSSLMAARIPQDRLLQALHRQFRLIGGRFFIYPRIV
ncbi:hypothetical protein J2W23_000553 [Variovorax boronicumulans]|uniref:hypothetical protein n=1 Tax=Variovorax boronicumulans TaxID=436515 RepID=UPI00278993DA|nr:hypothetical protein [Variovorax boronicumulans]MDQ0012189.1 hypothetical protein [Variovorax boronicumulans]